MFEVAGFVAEMDFAMVAKVEGFAFAPPTAAAFEEYGFIVHDPSPFPPLKLPLGRRFKTRHSRRSYL